MSVQKGNKPRKRKPEHGLELIKVDEIRVLYLCDRKTITFSQSLGNEQILKAKHMRRMVKAEEKLFDTFWRLTKSETKEKP